MMAVKILVVDDEPDLEPLMLRRFHGEVRDGEFDFTFARDGVEALDRIELKSSYDMVLCDISRSSVISPTRLPG